MTTLSWISRGGPPAALLAAMLVIAPAGAATSKHQRFSITGSLTPTGVDSTSNGGGVELKSTLSRPKPGSDVQAGGSFVVLAKMVASPMGCASDLIFADGFDGP